MMTRVLNRCLFVTGVLWALAASLLTSRLRCANILDSLPMTFGWLPFSRLSAIIWAVAVLAVVVVVVLGDLGVVRMLMRSILVSVLRVVWRLLVWLLGILIIMTLVNALVRRVSRSCL